MGVGIEEEDKVQESEEYYKKYLGGDYKAPKEFTTIVNSHISWIVFS